MAFLTLYFPMTIKMVGPLGSSYLGGVLDFITGLAYSIRKALFRSVWLLSQNKRDGDNRDIGHNGFPHLILSYENRDG
jgi:hypothetical protein